MTDGVIDEPRPLGEEAAQALGAGRRRVLVVHNIRSSRADEIARLVPLFEALLT